MESNQQTSTDKPNFFQSILKSNEYAIGATLLSYILGFAITNLFLGSFGVVNLDVLRIRYILTGLLFGVFISIIIFPIYGLIHVLRKNREASIASLITSILLFSFHRYSIIYLGVSAVSLFAATSTTPKIPVSDQPQKSLWTDWLSKFPEQILIPSLLMLSVILIAAVIVFFLVFLIVFAINPKDKEGNRQSRKEFLKQAYKELLNKSKVSSFIRFFIVALIFIIVLLSVSSLIKFFGGSSFNFRIPSVSGGWARFIGLAFLIYILVTAYLTFVFLMPDTSDDNDLYTTDDPLDRYYSWIYIFAWGIILIVPVYALNIYPNLPQQVGGGEIVKVNVLTSDELSDLFLNGNTDVYILDHTSRGAIFLLVDTNNDDRRIVEVAENEIKSLIYELPEPTPSVTPTSLATPINPSLTATSQPDPSSITSPVSLPTVAVTP